jgi:alpha-glucuronidase
MQLSSWHVYESYTGPLGAGTLTNILGNHYDPGPESSEENGWGQWHRADHAGIGMDRTVATGTGFIGQYPPAVQKLYESLATCPDNLILFFHHVPYAYVLHSGKTVIQHIYDSHYDGANHARDFVPQWKALAGHIDEERYRDILTRLQYQAGEAVVWRDTIGNWIYRLSGIPDDKGRVGSEARKQASAQTHERSESFEQLRGPATRGSAGFLSVSEQGIAQRIGTAGTFLHGDSVVAGVISDCLLEALPSVVAL